MFVGRSQVAILYQNSGLQALIGLCRSSTGFWIGSCLSQNSREACPVKKEPVTPEMLTALVNARITDKCPCYLSDIRMVTLCLIS